METEINHTILNLIINALCGVVILLLIYLGLQLMPIRLRQDKEVSREQPKAKLMPIQANQSNTF